MDEFTKNTESNNYDGMFIHELFQWAEADDPEAQCRLGICYCNGENGVEKNLEEAVQWFDSAARRGNADAQNRLGVRYDRGEGVKEDPITAFTWFSSAAAQGHLKAMRNLGLYYLYGRGVEKNEYKAVEWFRKAAEQGFANAQYQLGYCYYFGEGIMQNPVKAVEWLTKAVAQNDPDAQWLLGLCYVDGNGVAKDVAQAFKLFQKSADQGNDTAQDKLGDCYYSGIGTEENDKLAVEWYRKAAEQGNAAAQCSLGECYYRGDGVEKNEDHAFTWFQRAADQGHAEAQRWVGMCKYWGKGTIEDDVQAVAWFRKAAEQDDAGAQYFLGRCYYYGQGVSEDDTQAVSWFRKSAEQGYAAAQGCLGECLLFGDGTEKDGAQAVDWLRKGAEQKDEQAQYYLAVCYRTGLGGIEKNPETTVKLLQQAAEQEYSYAQCELGKLYYFGDTVPKDDMLAFGWFSKAAEQELPGAQCWLGKCYYFGNGTVQDWDEARKWFEASKENGDEDAEWWLSLLEDSNPAVIGKLSCQCTPAERLEALSHLLENQTDLAIGHQLTDYHSITNKQKVNIVKNFDERINTEEIFSILDTTLFGTMKNGIVFSLHGVYFLELFEKPIYFNYSDVDAIVLTPDSNNEEDRRKSRIGFLLRDGRSLSLTDTCVFDKYMLRNIIDCLRCADKTWNLTKGHKTSGAVSEAGLTEEQKTACDFIIHGASVAAGGVGSGLAQIPVIDAAVITPIQIGMITSLGAVFDIRVTEGMAKGIITSMGAAVVGRGVSQLLIGWIPGLGNAFNTATAAGITEAIGWAAVKHFCDLNAKDRAKHRVVSMQAGYEAASDEYEEKLLRQAEAFKKDKELLCKDITGYQKLLQEYEAYITALEAANDESNIPLIQRLQAECDELKALEASADEP